MKTDRVLMDAKCNLHYSAFYIEGLKTIFKNKLKIDFSSNYGFPLTKQCFLFCVFDGQKEIKFAIDFHDSRDIEASILEWCDCYGKINLHPEISKQSLVNSDQKISDFDLNWNKVISIPPGFGIRVFNLLETVTYVFKLIIHMKLKEFSSTKLIILNCIRMYIKRLPLKRYSAIKNVYKDKKNVFLIATIWHKSTSFVNIKRANFIRLCKNNLKIKFEGGFVDVGYEIDYIDDIEQLKTGNTKISLSKYIEKTQQSYFVYNTPSVLKCHGWKLAEYLCMGKAIISSPLSNDLPAILEHGKHIFILDENEQEMEKAINLLESDPDFVAILEQNALKYWHTYATPEKVIENLLMSVSNV